MKKNDLSYSELEFEIINCPKTWVMALLIVTVRRACQIPIFRPGKLVELVKRIEKEVENERP